MPAIAARDVWEKVTKGRAGIRWDSVVEKGWKDIGGNQEEVLQLFMDKFGGYKTDRCKRKDANKGKASAKKQNEGGGALERITRGLEKRKK